MGCPRMTEDCQEKKIQVSYCKKLTGFAGQVFKEYSGSTAAKGSTHGQCQLSCQQIAGKCNNKKTVSESPKISIIYSLTLEKVPVNSYLFTLS